MIKDSDYINAAFNIVINNLSASDKMLNFKEQSILFDDLKNKRYDRILQHFISIKNVMEKAIDIIEKSR